MAAIPDPAADPVLSLRPDLRALIERRARDVELNRKGRALQAAALQAVRAAAIAAWDCTKHSVPDEFRPPLGANPSGGWAPTGGWEHYAQWWVARWVATVEAIRAAEQIVRTSFGPVLRQGAPSHLHPEVRSAADTVFELLLELYERPTESESQAGVVQALLAILQSDAAVLDLYHAPFEAIASKFESVIARLGGMTSPSADGICALCVELWHPPTMARPRARKGPSRTLSDHEKDRRIAAAWKTGRYKTHEALGVAWGSTRDQVRQALDRHRKWRKS